MKKIYIIAFAACFALVAIVTGLIAYRPTSTSASTTVGSSYKSLVTAPTSTVQAYKQNVTISSTSGTLGSVVITGLATGSFTLYDASTSNSTLRNNVATSSLPIIANFPASAAAGTYTFDASYYTGLVVEFLGNVASTTITWRPY